MASTPNKNAHSAARKSRHADDRTAEVKKDSTGEDAEPDFAFNLDMRIHSLEVDKSHRQNEIPNIWAVANEQAGKIADLESNVRVQQTQISELLAVRGYHERRLQALVFQMEALLPDVGPANRHDLSSASHRTRQ